MTNPIPTQYFCDLAARPSQEIVPGIRIKTFWQAQMLLSMAVLDPGAILPRHSHPEEQCGAIMAGEITLTIGAETKVLRAGDAYMVPGGLEHNGIAGPEGATILDVFAPVRSSYQFE